ncbi:MAG: DUF2341 domain-containing protein [Acidimicrobiales bacterium]
MIAAPADADSIADGDVLVMPRQGLDTLTHRVIKVEGDGADALYAITKGDANEAPDATPYPLDDSQLVARWILPGWGGRLEAATSSVVVLVATGLLVLLVLVGLLKRIWVGNTITANGVELQARRRPTRVMAAVALPLVGLMTAGVAWALFTTNDAVAGNDFSTSSCFDPELGSVQNGTTLHAIDGVVSIPITPVDPSSSFLMLSARSSGNEPVAAAVRGTLTAGGTLVELERRTDAGVPEPLSVAWSVIEYPCGLTVQRGSASGTGSAQINATIAAVDMTSSFVLSTSSAEPTATDFDADDLFITELTSPTNLRIRSEAPAVFDSLRQFSWQVVTFDDDADIDVQRVSMTLGAGTAADTAVLASPVDPATTFLLTGTASVGSGPAIGDRMVRSHLSSPTTIDVSRQITGVPVEVHVQAVTLRDGSTVRHGTVDFTAGQASRTVSMDPVDPSRSTAISTVAAHGPSAGGSTDMAADDVVGEASATFSVVDATTVAVDRDATAASASFGWQVIEWAGPRWWDPDYEFRQRIDATATTAAAPDAYTLPVTFDHDALVTSGLSLADGSDVRIVRWDGAAWSELDRIVDPDSAWNQTSTTVWFRTADPIAAASTISYWLYFGNNTPGPVADDPENVFLLTEDFESGSLGDFEDRTGGTSWYTASPWTRRLPITVAAASVGDDLTDFPLLVSITEPDLATNAQADGSDIRFIAADGVTPLAHEIERWNPGTGELIAWVRTPTLSSTVDTTMFLYYGSSDAPDQQAVRSLWTSEVEAVWHLADDPAGTAPQVDDSSPANRDGLSGGAMSSTDLVPGLIGDGVDLDGVDDVLTTETFELAGAASITVSGWVRLDSYNAAARVVTKASGLTGQVFELTAENTGAARVRLSLDGSTVTAVGGAGTIGIGSWHHVAGTWDGAVIRLYIDGTEVANTPATGSIDVGSAMPVTIGNLTSGDRPLDGRLDEIRVESAARSIDWLAASEANQRTPGSFAVASTVETGSWLGQGSWAARKPIAIDADYVSGSLTDFAVLIDLTDTELQAQARADGADIVFTDADGTTRLDHIVESYESATGALTAWVKVPSVGTAIDTELFMYYGNPVATDQQDPTAVFGDDADLALLLAG